MQRFFVEPAQVQHDRVTLTGENAHQVTRVLRLGPGDAFVALDGSGTAYEATIEQASREQVSARVVRSFEAPEPPLPIVLYQALPKADKLEVVIQKATELGALRIVPVAAERSVVQLKGDRAEGKLARWQKIAREAAEQCERGRVPLVEAPIALKNLALTAGTLGLVLSERAEGLTLPRALPEQRPEAIALFVGPEGGWTPGELDLLRGNGVREVSLGRRILRTETAGLAALAIILAAYELL